MSAFSWMWLFLPGLAWFVLAWLPAARLRSTTRVAAMAAGVISLGYALYRGAALMECSDAQTGISWLFAPVTAVAYGVLAFAFVWALAELQSFRDALRLGEPPGWARLAVGMLVLTGATLTTYEWIRSVEERERAARGDVSSNSLRLLADEAIASDRNDLLMSLAENDRTPTDVLERLAAHRWASIRSRVAGNRITPEPVIRRLSTDRDESVRLGVTGNPSTPRSVMSALRSDPVEIVRRNAQETLRRREK